MAAESGFADQDDDDARLRPAWEDTPDETDADRRAARAGGARPRPTAAAPTPGSPAQRCPPCSARSAPPPTRSPGSTPALPRSLTRVRDGLIARMAFAEAAGWLAHAHAWVHPLDLSLRVLGLTAPTALAAVGAGHRALPQTFAGPAEPRDWADPPFEAMADGDRAIADALALARLLRRPPKNTGGLIFAGAPQAAETLASLGASGLDGENFAAWWSKHAPKPGVRRRRYGSGAGEGGDPPLPPLLQAAHAAQSWMEAGITDPPAPAHALFAATGLVARAGVTRAVFLPVWAAYPAAGFGDRDALAEPAQRAADVVGRDRPVTWPLAFLHLVAESARAGLRELDRLEAAAEQGRGLAADLDKRSRLPDAIDALLRTPALTPKALAGRLGIAPQTGTALLRALQAKGVVREVTGRGSFRAFAV